VDLEKIETMKYWSHPKTLKILKGFLGLTRYYHKFFQNYGKIVSPLTALLKKNAFIWNLVADQSFQALKEAMCMTLVLALLGLIKIFFLECDTSRKGIRVVLMQYGRPLDFTRKQLSE
jgi:hypothetical protein